MEFELEGKKCVFMFDTRRGRMPIHYKRLDTGATFKASPLMFQQRGIMVPRLPSKDEWIRSSSYIAEVRGYIHPEYGGDDMPFHGKYSKNRDVTTPDAFKEYVKGQVESYLMKQQSAVMNDWIAQYNF